MAQDPYYEDGSLKPGYGPGLVPSGPMDWSPALYLVGGDDAQYGRRAVRVPRYIAEAERWENDPQRRPSWDGTPEGWAALSESERQRALQPVQTIDKGRAYLDEIPDVVRSQYSHKLRTDRFGTYLEEPGSEGLPPRSEYRDLVRALRAGGTPPWIPKGGTASSTPANDYRSMAGQAAEGSFLNRVLR